MEGPVSGKKDLLCYRITYAQCDLPQRLSDALRYLHGSVQVPHENRFASRGGWADPQRPLCGVIGRILTDDLLFDLGSTKSAASDSAARLPGKGIQLKPRWRRPTPELLNASGTRQPSAHRSRDDSDKQPCPSTAHIGAASPWRSKYWIRSATSLRGRLFVPT